MTKEFQFYIVPTPIGNLGDITLRAIEILRSVDLIACEDTRTTQKLLNHYNIKTKCISYHKYNEKERIDFLLKEINSGKKIALVSDAGTPTICDPGSVIISALNQNNISYTSLPGACAITTFLSQVSRTTEKFLFLGFMPKSKKQIEECLKEHVGVNIVFYESPERLFETLDVIQGVYGDVQVSVGRELSKIFEEVKTFSITGMKEYYQKGVKGELVCMLHAIKQKQNNLKAEILELKHKGFKDKEIATILSTLYDANKNDVYKQSLNLK